LVEGLWQPLRELNFNYSGISVASALRVSNGTDRDRTDDLALRRRLLYPTEPQPQQLFI